MYGDSSSSSPAESFAWYSVAWIASSIVLSRRQRKHGPWRFTVYASVYTLPEVAFVIVSSDGT